MITIKKISINELPPLVYFAYAGDDDFFDKYSAHEVPENAKHIGHTNSELALIYDMRQSFKLCYYKVIYQRKAIGYFVSFDGNLYSFAINKAFRKKDILLHWWQKIRQTLSKDFLCMLSLKNERAISFLKKNRMAVIEEDVENDTIVLRSY